MPENIKEECLWVLSKTSVCGAEATSVVTMRNQLGAVEVPVCDKHLGEHNRKAAALRANNKRKNK